MSDDTPRPNDGTETAALDEAWSALRQLLAATQPRLDEENLVRQVCGRHARRRAKRRRFTVLALAATLFLGVGVMWWTQVSARLQIARGPQIAGPAAAIADFAWRDELAEEIESATSTLASVRSQVRGEFDRARWVQQEMDELESEMELSSL